MCINKKIFKSIKRILADKELSMEDLAILTKEKKSTVSTRLSRLSKGKGITTTSLEKILKGLKVPLSELNI